jgi:hypothetical protein
MIRREADGLDGNGGGHGLENQNSKFLGNDDGGQGWRRWRVWKIRVPNMRYAFVGVHPPLHLDHTPSTQA